MNGGVLVTGSHHSLHQRAIKSAECLNVVLSRVTLRNPKIVLNVTHQTSCACRWKGLLCIDPCDARIFQRVVLGLPAVMFAWTESLRLIISALVGPNVA
jgi:hypothetical protein